MSSSNYLPRSIKGFREWVKKYFLTLALIYESLNISKETYGDLVNAKNIWDAADNAAEDPKTATAVTIRERVRVMTDFTKNIRAFNTEYVTHNHLLTTEQRDLLGLLPVKPPSPQPPPQTRPHVEITTAAPGDVTAHCFGDEVKWGMEEGVHGYEWGWVISDTTPASYDELTHSEFSTRAYHTKTFDPSQRTKKLQSAFRWENEKGEKGPWTDFIETIIP
jgi:hypothetical protein